VFKTKSFVVKQKIVDFLVEKFSKIRNNFKRLFVFVLKAFDEILRSSTYFHTKVHYCYKKFALSIFRNNMIVKLFLFLLFICINQASVQKKVKFGKPHHQHQSVQDHDPENTHHHRHHSLNSRLKGI